LPKELRQSGKDDRMVVGDDEVDHPARRPARIGIRMSRPTPVVAERMSSDP
jgi:hypothetical protein